MRYILFAIATVCACSQAVPNPVSPDYPCGTRSHVCSKNPLMCCWNSEVCGGPVGTGCPAGYCCYIGDDYGAAAPRKQDVYETPQVKQ